MKILLIEDEKLLAQTLKDLLTAKGFQVEVVYDGETGAEYALLGIYDLLILDVMMPGACVQHRARHPHEGKSLRTAADSGYFAG